MASFDAMRLTTSQVKRRMRSLEVISDNLERYVQGLKQGRIDVDEILQLANHMLVFQPVYQSDYSARQDSPIDGSIGHQLKGRQFVDKLLFPAWIIQIGSEDARTHYRSSALSHRNLHSAVIDEISDIERAGDKAYQKHKKQKLLPISDQDTVFMLFYENRMRLVHHAIARVMKKDHLFVMDPYEVWKYVFRVRVATFFIAPSFLVGTGAKDFHIMDQHLVSERLLSLLYMATKHQSWLKTHIVAARAALLRMEPYDDLRVLDMFLGSSRNITPTTESVILVSVAMWMHMPSDARKECSSQLMAYRELVRILDEEAKTNPLVHNMWKGPWVLRALPRIPGYLPEEASRQSQQGLIDLCKTEAGLKDQRKKQLKRAAVCQKLMSQEKARQAEAEKRERERQDEDVRKGISPQGATGNKITLQKPQEVQQQDDQAEKVEQQLAAKIKEPPKVAQQPAKIVSKVEKSAQRPPTEQQQTPPDNKHLEEESQQVLADIIDDINTDGQLGDDCRWFWRLMGALANPDQPLNDQGFDYLDHPDMLKGHGVNALNRMTRLVQRRKDFGGTLAALLDGSISRVEELGPMADYFQAGRIVVDKHRAQLPGNRIGRGLLMLRMMVAALEPTRSTTHSTTQTEATPASAASVSAAPTFPATPMVVSPFSATDTVSAPTAQAANSFSAIGAPAPPSRNPFLTTAPATTRATGQATPLYSTAAKPLSPSPTASASSTPGGRESFSFKFSTTGTTTARPPAFSSLVPDSIAPRIAAPATDVAPNTAYPFVFRPVSRGSSQHSSQRDRGSSNAPSGSAFGG